MKKKSPAYLWLTGHVRNVGDSMLRRPLADLYRETGPISVWSGAPGSGYEKGLRITNAESARSFLAWALEFTLAAIRGKPTFVFNAGEFGVTKAYFFGLLALAPALALASAKGSNIIWAGAGVKELRRYFMWPFKTLAKRADVLLWRDVTSTGLMGRGDIMPDWGFGLGPGGEKASTIKDVSIAARRYIAISLRGDRQQPSQEWIEAVGRLALRVNRKLICVVQVEDDEQMAQYVANRLNAEVVAWGDSNHWEQERRIRLTYSQAVLTLSDRLHGLIIAATEGSIPLGWCEATTPKVANHFEVIGADWVGPRSDSIIELLDSLDEARIEALSTLSLTRVHEARCRVDAVRRRLRAAEHH
ncbi:polysaccharide pyruvyl transferase family protein [Leucobacter sp. wl10]|uniref:polysaccharide pyruvyl transferase family protein n=1 Tax=Leucobacter sp. wl10 TaxID=2304677 RepID=UPI0013C36815|nr:polysaccharide pyruvyl transferase family protein [Leucobacter sp. wl10]